MLWVGMLFVLALPLRAQDLTPDRAVEAGREALQESGNYPWYDEQQDGLRDLHAKTKQSDDTDTRKTGWEWETPDYQVNPPNVNWQFPTVGTIFQYIAIALLAGLVITLVVLLIRYFLKQEDAESSTARSEEVRPEDRAGDVDRVEQLSFQVREPDADLLSEARRLYEAGRYDEAIVYLFSYELVQLDKHQHIHLSKGKTNRQYLRELRQQPELRGILHRTMIAFEDVFFGRHTLEREQFDQSWQQIDVFHAALEQGVPA
jgi:hypothetical protein